MPGSETPLNAAATKAVLRRRIAARREDLAAAGRTLAAPLLVVDRCISGWRALPPLPRVAVAAAGSFVAARLLRGARRRAVWRRLLPFLLGVLGRLPSSRL